MFPFLLDSAASTSLDLWEMWDSVETLAACMPVHSAAESSRSSVLRSTDLSVSPGLAIPFSKFSILHLVSFFPPLDHPLFRGDRIKKIFDFNKRTMSSPQQKQVQARHAAEQELALEAMQASSGNHGDKPSHSKGRNPSPKYSQTKPGKSAKGKGRGKGNYLHRKK